MNDRTTSDRIAACTIATAADSMVDRCAEAAHDAYWHAMGHDVGGSFSVICSPIRDAWRAAVRAALAGPDGGGETVDGIDYEELAKVARWAHDGFWFPHRRDPTAWEVLNPNVRESWRTVRSAVIAEYERQRAALAAAGEAGESDDGGYAEMMSWWTCQFCERHTRDDCCPHCGCSRREGTTIGASVGAGEAVAGERGEGVTR